MARKLSESFIHRMAEAAFWESYVATCLSRMGFHVMHFPTDIPEDGFQKAGMYDSADLALMAPAGEYPYDQWGESAFIEVKSWVNGPPKVITVGKCGDVERAVLCSQSSWDKKGYGHGLHPIFVIINKATGDMMWLPGWANVSTGCSWSDPGRSYTEKVVCFCMDDLKPMEELREHCDGSLKKT